ncbi:MAG: hypothetical protein ACKVYV_02425 [Limisphaerales bacterium]
MSPKLTLCRRALPLLAAAFFTTCTSLRAEVVFDSTATSGQQVLPGAGEVGDEIILAGEARTITRLRLEFFAIVPVGATPTARLRIYENDGEPPAGFPPNIRAPRTILFTAPEVPITAGQNTLDLSGVAIDVPGKFTVSLQLLGLPGDGLSSGPVFYGRRTLKVGSGFDDYWLRLANGAWTTARFDNGIPPVHFSMLIEAQPDPPIRLPGLDRTNALPVVRVSGPITSNVVLESAADVAGPWTAWSTNRFTNGPIRVTDPRGFTGTNRIYRGRQP